MENNKTTETTIYNFKAIRFMREERGKISNEIKGMNFEQIKRIS